MSKRRSGKSYKARVADMALTSGPGVLTGHGQQRKGGGEGHRSQQKGAWFKNNTLVQSQP